MSGPLLSPRARCPRLQGLPPGRFLTGSSQATIQGALSTLNPGDVLQFQNGTYNVSSLQITRSGTVNNPIYIRGVSRAGVVLSSPGRVLQILNASHVIIEN